LEILGGGVFSANVIAEKTKSIANERYQTQSTWKYRMEHPGPTGLIIDRQNQFSVFSSQ